MSRNMILTGPQGQDSEQDDAALSEQSEARMRQSLAMLSSSSPQPRGPQHGGPQHGSSQQSRASNGAAPRRHRFVQDGEVPVVHVSNTRLRDAVQPATPPESPPDDAHRQAAEHRLRQAERALEAAQSNIRSLQTRLSHAELAQSEAQSRTQAAIATAAALRVQLRDEQAALAAERQALGKADHDRRALQTKLEEARAGIFPALPAAAPVPELKRAPARIAKPRVAGPKLPAKPRAAKEPKPVKWWLPTAAKAKP